MSARTAYRVCAGLIVATLAAGAASGGTAQAAEQCDRACLQHVVDQYLDALVARDHSRGPFAAHAKYTENGQELGLDDGLWKTANGNSGYRLYVADPAQGQVAFIGVIKEHDLPVIIAVRLKIEGHKISEAETIASRVSPGGFAKPENFVKPLPIFLARLQPALRVSREEMIRIADSYFTGLDTDRSGKNVPFDKDCQRRENGTVTANSKDPKASPMGRLGCKAQFDTGFSALVTQVRERRFPVVDVERGLVYAVVFFDHAGKLSSYTTPEGKVVPIGATFRRPLTLMIGELFKIEHGKIRQIEAVLLEVPYRMPSGWSQ